MVDVTSLRDTLKVICDIRCRKLGGVSTGESLRKDLWGQKWDQLSLRKLDFTPSRKDKLVHLDQ